MSDEDIVMRMMLPMLIESARCLEEKIVASPVEVDMGLLLGLGFPPFRAGIFKWADMQGLGKLHEHAQKWQSLGKLYEFTPTMLEMTKSNRKYHA
jgi:3-hydroxyacyl-CoA dehydrogenase/enoyl-CoA hydratase/3-hydroxybutyryl-CoA epimerase/enoyl-CoA isomerase